jgi:uncharacterized protein YjaZ
MKNLIVLFVILLLTSCSQPAKQNALSEKPLPAAYVTPAGDKIVFLYDYYVSFLKGVRAGNKNIDSLYRVTIQYPIENNYFSKCEYSDLVKSQFYYSIQDTTGLQNYIYIIIGSKEKMEKIITSALADANKYLKNDSITIYIQPSTNYLKTIIQKMGGITGLTAGSKQILLSVDTGITGWDEMLKYTVAHEFTHTYWTKKNFSNSSHFTLLDYLCFEGRADSYAHLIYPDIKCPWTSALMDNDKTDLWNKIKPELNSGDPTLMRGVMFGSADYPLWGGYTLGYSIVQSALKNHPELTPEQWASLEPEKILEMSDYKLP